MNSIKSTSPSAKPILSTPVSILLFAIRPTFNKYFSERYDMIFMNCTVYVQNILTPPVYRWIGQCKNKINIWTPPVRPVLWGSFHQPEFPRAPVQQNILVVFCSGFLSLIKSALSEKELGAFWQQTWTIVIFELWSKVNLVYSCIQQGSVWVKNLCLRAYKPLYIELVVCMTGRTGMAG